MASLPKHIYKAILSNSTSLGDNPALPPEEEDKFLMSLLSNKYTEMTEDLDIVDVEQMKNALEKYITKCSKIESLHKEELEHLCLKIVLDVLDVPDGCIDLSVEIVNNIDSSNIRMLPDKTEGFTFDSISDMKSLTKEVYKRRVVNAMVAGAAMYYGFDLQSYVSEIYKIAPELPLLYYRILKYNNLLLYMEKVGDKEEGVSSSDAGNVDVQMSKKENITKVSAQGLIFPVLLEETYKGLFELAASHGLPEDMGKAEYVMKKADFKLCEAWDMRIGLPMWERIMSLCDDDVDPNFLIMELSSLPVDEFNESMQDILQKTNRGSEIINGIIEKINHSKDKDDFDSYIEIKNDSMPLDDGYYTADELVETGATSSPSSSSSSSTSSTSPSSSTMTPPFNDIKAPSGTLTTTKTTPNTIMP